MLLLSLQLKVVLLILRLPLLVKGTEAVAMENARKLKRTIKTGRTSDTVGR
jgi:hypothetical protein